MSDVSLPLPLRYPPCSARPPTQTDLTRRRSVFPTTPSLRPWPGHHSSCRRGRCRLTPSTQRPSRADLTRRLSVLVGIFAVPRYPLSTPVDVKFAVVVTQTVLHNSQTSSLHNSCVICRLLHSVRVRLIMCIASDQHVPALHIVGWSHLSSFTLSACSFIHVYNIWLTCLRSSRLEPSGKM